MYAKLTRIQGERRIPLFVNLDNCANIEAAENGFGSRLQFNRSHDPVIAVTETPEEVFRAALDFDDTLNSGREVIWRARMALSEQEAAKAPAPAATTPQADQAQTAATETATTPAEPDQTAATETATTPAEPDQTGTSSDQTGTSSDQTGQSSDQTGQSSDASAPNTDGEVNATTPASSRRGGSRSGG